MTVDQNKEAQSATKCILLSYTTKVAATCDLVKPKVAIFIAIAYCLDSCTNASLIAPAKHRTGPSFALVQQVLAVTTEVLSLMFPSQNPRRT